MISKGFSNISFYWLHFISENMELYKNGDRDKIVKNYSNGDYTNSTSPFKSKKWREAIGVIRNI